MKDAPKKSPGLPPFLSFHFMTYFLYAKAVYIHSKYLKKGSYWKAIYRRSKTSFK